MTGERKVVLRGLSPGTDGALLARHCSGKALNTLELVEQLCAVSKPLALARRVHVRHFGSLVPHVFMGEVLAYVRGCDCRSEADAIVGVLKSAASRGDARTRQLIASSK